MEPGEELLERLQREVVVGDGANGGRLYELGADIGEGSEILNLRDPGRVRQVHEEYVLAGAELIETNTFAASRPALARHGNAERAEEVNLAGVRLAREAAGGRALLSGSVGPVAWTREERWPEEELRAVYREQIGWLLEGGVHLIQLETFTRLDELLLALEEAREACGAEIPVAAQMLFLEGGRVVSGEHAKEVATRLRAAGADIVGTNCGRGVAAIRVAAEELLEGAGDAPVACYPNAGFPENIDGRLVYRATPEYLAANAVDLAKAGVHLLGGCCGTTPETIRAIANAIRTIRTVAPTRSVPAVARKAEETRDPSRCGAFLAGREAPLPVIAELDPPPHLDAARVLGSARRLAEVGVDAISLSENPLASARMSNIAVSARIRAETGLAVIPHLTCRDRNLLGLHSALMGLHLLGAEAVLTVTGDPTPPHGGLGRSVFDTDSLGLIRLVAGLNEGVTAAGADLRGETDFSIGVAFNSHAPRLEAETRRLERKAAAGAHFVMTQPVFDRERALRILERTRATGLRVFLGIFPLVSARSAMYLHNEVPGILLPAPLLEAMRAAGSREEEARIGAESARDLVASLLPDLDGLYLIAPFSRAEAVAPLAELALARRAEER